MSILDDIAKSINREFNLLFDREIRIGVTGLSGGGKSTFITSLVNLISAFGENGTAELVPRFRSYNDFGFVYGGLAGQRDLKVPSFPYQKALSSLYAREPSWPEATSGVSEIRLELRYKNQDLISFSETKSLYIDIWDYPGEWLMDLMLLDLNYEEFSERIRKRVKDLDEVSLKNEWVSFGSSLHGDDAFDQVKAEKLVQLYTDWLLECKSRGFAMVVPGRLVLPGDLKGAPILQFVPWIWDHPANVSSTSLYSVFSERYENYREQVVRKFYTDCFSKLDRQIILVDCLKALMGGRETFMDINDSFEVLLEHFSYGSSSFLSRLFYPKIDKVIFAATKADEITLSQHENMLNLLCSMVSKAARKIRADCSNCEFMLLSSIRASKCLYAEHEGEQVQVLSTDYPDEKPFFPGSVPARWSREGMEFFQKYFSLRELRPPLLSMDERLPNINMDLMLEYLLKDKL